MLSDVRDFVSRTIGPQFHQRRIDSLRNLRLSKILTRKNPYLFRAKDITDASALMRGILSAHLSSQEETIFGDFLEQVAVFVCERALGGRKSGVRGIDLELDKDGIRYAIAVKSGPNWGNSGQIREMKSNFLAYRRTVSTSGSRMHVECINGCCYGRTSKPDRDGYTKICGQDFWGFISDNPSLYLDIIEPLGHDAKIRNADFERAFDGVLNNIVVEFVPLFCDSDGNIDWNLLTAMVSSSRRPRSPDISDTPSAGEV